LFAEGPSQHVRMLAIVVISTSLMFLDYRQEHLSKLRQAISTLLSPIQLLVSYPTDLVNWASEEFRSHGTLVSENQQLNDEILILRAQSQRMVELEAENSRLKALMGSVSELREHRQIADIISVKASEFNHEVLLNKGKVDKVYVGQPVIDASGIMGQVTEVSRFTSRVILITDERHAIPVRDLRNGVRAIAAGTGNLTRLVLIQIPHSFDIEVNDTLVTSGLGQRFPSGFPVAKVSMVRHDPGENYAYIEATPLARLARSGQVILIWPKDKPNSKLFEEGNDNAR